MNKSEERAKQEGAVKDRCPGPLDLLTKDAVSIVADCEGRERLEAGSALALSSERSPPQWLAL